MSTKLTELPEPISDQRLLVTEDAPAYGVLAGLRALRRAGYEPWLAFAGRDAYSLRSRAHAGAIEVPDPGFDRAGYIRALADAAARLEVAAVLPGTELGLVALSEAAGAFPPGTALGTADPETVRRATDKLELGRLAADSGLETPPTILTTRGALESDTQVSLPAVVKAARTRTPTKEGGFATSFVRRVSTMEELLEAVGALPGETGIVQPALEGQLSASSGVAWRGEVVAMAHQVAHRIYPPGCGISAFAESVPPDPSVAAGVGRLIAVLGWSGIFQAQFLRSGDNNYLIDLNPRMYGSLALAVASGLNLPAIWADLLVGREPRLGTYRPGARFRSEERDLAGLGAAVAAGDVQAALGVLRPRRRTVHALGSLRDPLPLLLGGRLARVRRVLARRRSR